MNAEFFSPKSLAEFLGVPIRTVYTWNHVGTGPPVIRVGKLARYRRADVEAWLNSHQVRSAS